MTCTGWRANTRAQTAATPPAARRGQRARGGKEKADSTKYSTSQAHSTCTAMFITRKSAGSPPKSRVLAARERLARGRPATLVPAGGQRASASGPVNVGLSTTFTASSSTNGPVRAGAYTAAQARAATRAGAQKTRAFLENTRVMARFSRPGQGERARVEKSPLHCAIIHTT